MYPLKGKPIQIDPDLKVKLENRIVKTFHRLLKMADAEK